MRLLIIFSILALYSFSAVYPQLGVKATVLDEKDVPIPNATVYNSVTKRSVMTNKEGRFAMDCRPNDAIAIRCLGYQEFNKAAGELQNDGAITLTEAIVNMNEKSTDVKAIINNFLKKIPKNYPKEAAILSGIYKNMVQIEGECYGYVQSDVDILVDHITSRSFPAYKTKVYNLKASKHPDVEGVQMGITTNFYSQLWLLRHSFLWNFTRFEYRNKGTINYNGSKLARITFEPDQIDKSLRQYAGTMYIDLKTYALVYLQYELLHSATDYVLVDGRRNKPLKEDIRVMYEKNKGKYYPVYIINEGSLACFGSEMGIAALKEKDTVTEEFTYIFYVRDIKTDTKGFVENCQFYHELNPELMVKVEQTEDIKTEDFILETEKEKQLEKRYWKLK